tara:strand:+ start:224 stop:673 length:450 start_codon:yes stop_codon:yes gene_type:complete
MKKLFLIIIFFITSCGYQPIYSNNSLEDTEFYKISTQGENKINKLILNSLSLKENISNEKLPELFLSSLYGVEEISKNSKGQVETYRSSILVNIKIIKNKNTIKNKTFSDEFTYNKKDNKFELTEYQKGIRKQLTDGIIEDLFLFLNMK